MSTLFGKPVSRDLSGINWVGFTDDELAGIPSKHVHSCPECGPLWEQASDKIEHLTAERDRLQRMFTGELPITSNVTADAVAITREIITRFNHETGFADWWMRLDPQDWRELSLIMGERVQKFLDEFERRDAPQVTWPSPDRPFKFYEKP